MLRTIFYEILKTFFSEFSTTLLTHSLTHSLMHSVKRSGKLATATALLLWQKMLRISWQKNPSTILNAYKYALVSYSFSFDPSLW